MDVDAKKGSKWTKEETILAFDLTKIQSGHNTY